MMRLAAQGFGYPEMAGDLTIRPSTLSISLRVRDNHQARTV